MSWRRGWTTCFSGSGKDSGGRKQLEASPDHHHGGGLMHDLTPGCGLQRAGCQSSGSAGSQSHGTLRPALPRPLPLGRTFPHFLEPLG